MKVNWTANQTWSCNSQHWFWAAVITELFPAHGAPKNVHLVQSVVFFPLKLLENFVTICHNFSPALFLNGWKYQCILDMAAIGLQQDCIGDYLFCWAPNISHGYFQNATVSLVLQWHHITDLYLVAYFSPVWIGFWDHRWPKLVFFLNEIICPQYFGNLKMS